MSKELGNGGTGRKGSRYDRMDNDTFGKSYHRPVRSSTAHSKYEAQERAYFDNNTGSGGCLLVVAALVAGLAGFGVVNASTSEASTGQITSGTGWQLISPQQTTSLAPGTYTIQFDTAAARTKLTPYLKISAAKTQAQTAGVKFVVSSTLQKRVTTGCQTKNTIVVSLEYQPLGKKGSRRAATATTRPTTLCGAGTSASTPSGSTPRGSRRTRRRTRTGSGTTRRMSSGTRSDSVTRTATGTATGSSRTTSASSTPTRHGR